MLRLLATFLLATTLGSVGASLFAVLQLGDVDPKFRDSLAQGLPLELIGSAGFTVIATVVAGIMAATLHNRLAFSRVTFLVVAAWGLVHAVVWRLVAGRALNMFDPESLLTLTAGWIYLIAIPALMFVPLVKIGARSIAQQNAGHTSAL